MCEWAGGLRSCSGRSGVARGDVSVLYVACGSCGGSGCRSSIICGEWVKRCGRGVGRWALGVGGCGRACVDLGVLTYVAIGCIIGTS